MKIGLPIHLKHVIEIEIDWFCCMISCSAGKNAICRKCFMRGLVVGAQTKSYNWQMFGNLSTCLDLLWPIDHKRKWRKNQCLDPHHDKFRLDIWLSSRDDVIEANNYSSSSSQKEEFPTVFKYFGMQIRISIFSYPRGPAFAIAISMIWSLFFLEARVVATGKIQVLSGCWNHISW